MLKMGMDNQAMWNDQNRKFYEDLNAIAPDDPQRETKLGEAFSMKNNGAFLIHPDQKITYTADNTHP